MSKKHQIKTSRKPSTENNKKYIVQKQALRFKKKPKRKPKTD